MRFVRKLRSRKTSAAVPDSSLKPFPWLSPIILLSVFLAGHTDGRSKEDGLRRYEYTLARMGTLARVVIYAPDAGQAQRAASGAFDRIEELEDMLSDYREESELNRLAREAVRRPQAVSPELFYVLQQSRKFSELSGGAFDITIGPVVRLWREARRTKRPPAASDVEKAKALVDYRSLELDPATRTVMLTRAGMQLDLGGIAKGYAADQALEILKSHGIRTALVALGGDIRVSGVPPATGGWGVAIENPDAGKQKPLCTVALQEGAISTSGDTQQYLESGGVRFSHIVDPGSGVGLKNAASTTVIAKDGLTADALATTLSVMPVEQGLRLVESFEGASAFIVRRSADGFRYFRSRGFPPACGYTTRQE